MFDAQTRFSNQQSIAAAAGTVVSSNILDLQLVAAKGSDDVGNDIFADPGRQMGLKVIAQVTEAVTASGGAATVTAQLCTSANEDGSSPVVIQQTAAISKADLIAGYQFAIDTVPPGKCLRYLFMQFVIATNTTQTGKVVAGLVPSKFTNYSM